MEEILHDLLNHSSEDILESFMSYALKHIKSFKWL